MKATIWVKLPKGTMGYVIETKLNKSKIQLTDSSGFVIHTKQPDWCETSDLIEIESPTKSNKSLVNRMINY